MRFIQESTDLSVGQNLRLSSSPYSLPDQTENVAVFLLSGSYEYDLELIKRMPPPRTNYKTIVIPYSVSGKFGTSNFKYVISPDDYQRKISYLHNQKMIPQLRAFPNTKTNFPSTENIYIPVSDLFKSLSKSYRGLSEEYIASHAPELLNTIATLFHVANPRIRKIWMVDADKYRIYDSESTESMRSDIVNGIIGSYLGERLPNAVPNTTVVFRTNNGDYKMDLPSMSRDNQEALRKMCSQVGVPFKGSRQVDSDPEKVMDDIQASTNALNEGETENATNGGSGLKGSINALKAQYGVSDDGPRQRDSLYDAKTFEINASLIHQLSPNQAAVSNYKQIASDLSASGDKPVENQLITQAAEKLAGSRAPSNETSIMNTTTSAREQLMRSNIGQVRLKNLSVDTIGSVTDHPIPAPTHPLRLTTTNRGSLQGSAFPKIAREYEETMLDQDIVATFMTLQKLPEGFTVTGVEVEDISTPLSLVHNWKVSIKNKRTGTQSHFNIFVPKMENGRFLYNGTRYNISKQDFPIPVMKINGKTVILTSNYNKITVTRYDTKSLADLGMVLKTVASKNTADGKNPYVRYGSSMNTNQKYISTIEYDDYARKWYSYENKQAGCRILFNRDQCLREFGFVNVNANEFCCGMLNQVPIVLNTDTGLDRHGKTLTDIIVSTFPEELLKLYARTKPTKLSMYSQIKIMGIQLPLGVAICGWEGISSLLKRCEADYKYVSAKDDTTGYFRIPFKDQILAIRNTIQNQLLFNGFYRINTKQYTVADFDRTVNDENSPLIDIFNQLFFKQYSQKTTFITYYHFFVDAITEDVCRHYHLPTNICDMLIYSSNMLADNNFTSEHNATLYRIRSSEVIPAIIHYTLAVAISKYNNTPGSKTKDHKFTYNPNEVINTLRKLESVGTSSALNPMIELHETETVSKKGFGGLNADRAYSEAKRSFEENMIGKIAISTPNSANVGINRQMTIDPKLESLRGYTSSKGLESNFNDLQLASFSEMLTPGTVARDDAIRTAIATSQTGHILPTDEAEPVLVSNGVDEIVPSYLSDQFSVMAQEDGSVLEISEGYMIVQYASKKKQAIPVNDRYSFNPASGFYVDNKLVPNFQPGDKFKKNDILAYHEKFFSKDSSGMVRMNVGPLAKVAFAGTYATYEDAGLITEKMSKRLGTHVTMCQASKLNATDDIDHMVKVGDEIEIGDPLIVFGLGDTGDKSVDAFLKSFQNPDALLDTAKRVIYSKHAGVVKEIRMYTIKSMEKLSPSLFELMDAHFKDNIRKRKILDKYDKSNNVYKLDTLYSLPTAPLSGPTIKGIHCDVLIEIYIEHDDEVSIGDKCVVYAASKQVISEVVPEGMEPYAESTPDEEISMFVAPGSVLKRMIPSMIVTSSANKVLIELKKKVRQIWNGG